jgi:hypothetical protein
MKTRNGSDNAEPKAASGGATAPLEPVKALENVWMLVGGNSRSIIGDRNDAWARRTLVRHHASGSAVSRSPRVTGTAFPSVSWRHSEPAGAVVLAHVTGAWRRASS